MSKRNSVGSRSATLAVRALENRCVPAAFVVNNVNNAGAGSLRQAVLDANALAGADTITFDAATFATPQTILLTNGQITIADAVTIAGPPAATVTVSGNKASRIFTVDVPGKTGQAVTISSLTMTNGKVTGIGNNGGAILNNSQAVILVNSIVTNCVGSYGGALALGYDPTSLSITNCQISSNSATIGGAIYVPGNSTVSILRSTISGNSTSKSGAGIYFFISGTLSLIDSTVSNNKANLDGNGPFGGGGVYAPFDLTTIRNCTISNNSALRGAGIASLSAASKSVNVQNCTITQNTAVNAGGGVFSGSGQVVLTSTIVANNTCAAGPDVNGSVTANFSLIGNTSAGTITGANNKLNMAALLGSLAFNGGPTQTHALLPGSPCIDAGSNPASLSFDQRGNARSSGGTDIGAYEVQAPAKFAATIINDGQIQRSQVTQVKVSFNQHIGFTGNAAGAFSLRRVSDNAVVNLAASTDGTGTGTGTGTAVTLSFTGGAVNGKSLADGRYALHILAGGFNAEGFDGNGNGVAQGSPADDFAFDEPASPAMLDLTKVFRLFGDSDGNGLVDSVDFSAFRSAFGTNSAVFDFDGNGVADGLDFGQFRARYGMLI